MQRSNKLLFLVFLLLATSCNHVDPYREQKVQLQQSRPMSFSEHFIIFLVNARQLDYSDNQGFFKSLVKHPSDGSKNSDSGHAWIYLCGRQNNGDWIELEGGYSGETGRRCPKYFEGVMDYCEAGDPNPIRYLWQPLNDGYFQEGNGGHRPTFAIKVDLTPEKFHQVVDFVENYDFCTYSLTERQCCSFVQQVAAVVGLDLQVHIKMLIQPSIQVAGETIVLWRDDCFSKIEFPCPEVLECSLIDVVKAGHAECALDWYVKSRYKSRSLNKFYEDCVLLPRRLCRVMMF